MRRISFHSFVFLVLLLLLPISCLAMEPITVSIEVDNDRVQMGTPFVVDYTIKGGSGHYYGIECFVGYVYGNNLYDGGVSIPAEPDDASHGSIVVMPDWGKMLSVSIEGTDAVTGERFLARSDAGMIPIDENPDLQVKFTLLTSEVEVNEPIEIAYSIGDGAVALDETWAWWTVFNDSGSLSEDNYTMHQGASYITKASGTESYTPVYGDAAYLSICGYDSEGRVIYAESEPVPISNGHITPLTLNVKVLSEKIQVGQPFTIEYSLSGGSGSYQDIRYDLDLMNGDGYYGHYLHGTLEDCSASTGTITMIPHAGVAGAFSIAGSDAVTEQSFILTDPNTPIIIAPNPEIPVDICINQSSVEIGKALTVSYSIGAKDAHLEECTVEWTIREESRVENMEYVHGYEYTEITDLSGQLQYTPKFGDDMCMRIVGKTTDGKPFFVESDWIPIINPKYIVTLPSSLKRIDTEALAGIGADCVRIADSVECIAEDAFKDSSITTIIGRGKYLEEYAASHGFWLIAPED